MNTNHRNKSNESFPTKNIRGWILFCGICLAIVFFTVFVFLVKTSITKDETIHNVDTGIKTQINHTDEPENENEIEIEIEMVFVLGGTFIMGCTDGHISDCSPNEIPAHQVTVSSYNIGKYPITQAQWKAVMGNNPSHFKGDNLPVEQITWNEVQKFLLRLNEKTGKNYRLPTEAEWEYAARGGDKSKGYRYSGSNNVNDVAWYDKNSGGSTHPVGTKQPNELGIYDMSGNVYEWVQDIYKVGYPSSHQINPTGPTSGTAHRVLRGGNWNRDVSRCRVSDRATGEKGWKNSMFGFRVVLPM